ncbi:ATP-binding cassette domain-containing protein [uncultured Psychromonas sp.]|uniref:ATP-binding cassette domain-containing protein n=1 Tax=uncultured Psychromonas sp. TaxID=173974 RepID=UPI00262CF024|nr:ATP-binding cassette domain-containing protein [uncultured Psychromonas sp.]
MSILNNIDSVRNHNNNNNAINNTDTTFSSQSYSSTKLTNLTIKKGEFISLIGHSDCDSSILNTLMKHDSITSYKPLLIDNKTYNPDYDMTFETAFVPSTKRPVILDQQSLLPWLTAYQNVELAVEQVFANSMKKSEKKQWIKYNFTVVRMQHAMHKRPNELSEEMKQRVAIAHALSMQPKVLIMNEPFSCLDAITKADMQNALMDIHKTLNNSMILITQDIDQALLLSDKIIVISDEQSASIGESVIVDLPRPREQMSLSENVHFKRLKSELLDFLYQKKYKLNSIHHKVINTSNQSMTA